MEQKAVVSTQICTQVPRLLLKVAQKHHWEYKEVEEVIIQGRFHGRCVCGVCVEMGWRVG